MDATTSAMASVIVRRKHKYAVLMVPNSLFIMSLPLLLPPCSRESEGLLGVDCASLSNTFTVEISSQMKALVDVSDTSSPLANVASGLLASVCTLKITKLILLCLSRASFNEVADAVRLPIATPHRCHCTTLNVRKCSTFPCGSPIRHLQFNIDHSSLHSLARYTYNVYPAHATSV